MWKGTGTNLFKHLWYQMANKDVLSRLENRAVEAQRLILSLKSEITALNKLNYAHCHDKEFQDLMLENVKLARDIDIWKERLIQAEVKNGKLPIDFIKGESTKVESLQNNHIKATIKVENEPKDESVPVPKKGKSNQEKSKRSKDNESTPKTKKENTDKDKGDDKIDVGRLDLRIGRILSADKHPDADSLYVESVDLDKEKRTVVSGLVRFIEKKDLDGRLVVLLCNLKPAKMRGITSEAMVLCASTPEKVEVLNPPAGSVPGDIVMVEGFEHRPDPVLNPKKKVWETVAVDLKVNSDGIATYGGVALTVPGKGNISATSLKNVPIK